MNGYRFCPDVSIVASKCFRSTVGSWEDVSSLEEGGYI